MLIGNLYYFIVTFMILAAASSIMQFFYKVGHIRTICIISSALASILLFITIVVRTMESGTLPYNSVYGFTMVFSFVLTVLSLIIMIRYRLYGPVSVVLVLAVVLFASTFGMSSEITNLMPALQSKWRVVHISTAIVAYSCFAVTFGIGLYCIIASFRKKDAGNVVKKGSESSKAGKTSQGTGSSQNDAETRDSGKPVDIDSMLQNFVVTGFIFLTLLLVTGAMWAEEAWGAWWSWDPKETWALITWLIYAVYLHLHRRAYWKGLRGYYLIVLGFICVIFTLFGVTFLMGGLHSYA